MSLPKIIYLTSTCLLFLQGSHASGSPTPDAQHSPTDCLTAMNNARKAAGLSAFIQGAGVATLAGLAEKDQLYKPWNSNCKRMQEGVPGYHSSTTFFFAQQPGNAADCAAAVGYWQSGLSKFNGSVPPPYSNTTDVYSDLSFFGLVALYNPNARATVDCEFVICPVITSTSTKPPSPASGSDGGAQGGKGDGVLSAPVTADGEAAAAQRRRLEAVSTYNALVCMTTPPALVQGKEPFEKDQWKKIAGSVSGSPSATLSLFPLIALAALSIALF